MQNDPDNWVELRVLMLSDSCQRPILNTNCALTRIRSIIFNHPLGLDEIVWVGNASTLRRFPLLFTYAVINLHYIFLISRLIIDDRVFPVEVHLILAKMLWNLELELVESKGSTWLIQEAYLLLYSVLLIRFTRWVVMNPKLYAVPMYAFT